MSASSAVLAMPPVASEATQPNPNRQIEIIVNGEVYQRFPVRTEVVRRETDLLQLIETYAVPHAKAGDVLFISEKVVAITQGRAVRESEMKIGFTARVLWRCVAKVPYGIGLRRPSSMQAAVNECGAARIWLAAIVGALGKLVGRKGDFYRVAGPQAATIDAATTSPFQMDCVCLGPKDPDKVAAKVFGTTGIACAIVDVNDIGGSWVLGRSEGVDKKLVEASLKDNPLGQGSECTPMGLLRKKM